MNLCVFWDLFFIDGWGFNVCYLSGKYLSRKLKIESTSADLYLEN